MKKILPFIAILVSSTISLAQESNEAQTTPPITIHKLGIHAGTTSGLGISYKALFNNKTMLQLVSIPVASKENKYINSGISLKFKFKDLPEWDFYSYGALNHIYNESKVYNNFYNEMMLYNDDYTKTTISKFNTSAGISVEYGKGEFIKWCFQLGYGVYNIGTEGWQTNLTIGTTIDFSLNSK
jgi:hypothetical protein